MKPALIAAAAVILFAVPSQAQRRHDDRRDDKVVVDQDDLEREVDRLSHLLDEIAAERSARKRARLVARARERVDELRRMARARRHWVAPARYDPPPPQPAPAPPPPPAPPPVLPPPPRPVVYPMAQPAFQTLKAAIRRESFSRGKIRVLGQAAPSNWFLTGQVQQLLAELTYSRDKLEAMRILKPRLLDPENAFRLYGSFTYSRDKAELKRILEQ